MGFLSSIVKIAAPVVGGFLGGPAGAAIGSGIASSIGAEEQNSAAAAQSQSQMAFQERMSSTAHQREVKDLIAAGLNPLLSANHGSSTPAGSAAPVVNVADAGQNSARATAMTLAQMRQIDAQIDNTEAQTAANQTQAALNAAAIQKVKADTAVSVNSAVAGKINNALLESKLPSAANDAWIHSGVTGKILAVFNALGIGSDAVSSAGSAVKSFSKKSPGIIINR